MTGRVDSAGRALLSISLKPSATAPAVEIEAWVDTGFTGELVLPQDRIVALHLPQSAAVRVALGDGSETVLNTYSCVIEWLSQDKPIEVIANTGQFPLLGVGLLQDQTLTIDYGSRTLTIV